MSADRDRVLLALEQKLAQVGAKLQAGDAASLIADEFLEFGASGMVWRKAELLDALAHWPAIERKVENFHVTDLGSRCCLVTYRAVSADQRSASLRSSIWKQKGSGWQIVFHQGTPCPEPTR